MGSFKLGGMTFGSLFKKPETLLYPLETKTPPAGLKGHIVNDVDACILCGMCQKSCPCHCIRVDKAELLWEIDPFMCVQCGTCVRVCPTKCLSMDGTPTPVATAKYRRDLTVPKKEKKAKAADAGAQDAKAEPQP